MSDQNQIETEVRDVEESKIIRPRIRAKNPPEMVTEADIQRLAQTINELLKNITVYRDTMKWYANGGSDTGERARHVLELVKK